MNKNKLRHGKGIMNWPDGSKYDGDFRNDLSEGRGIFYHANGDIYLGEYV